MATKRAKDDFGRYQESEELVEAPVMRTSSVVCGSTVDGVTPTSCGPEMGLPADMRFSSLPREPALSVHSERGRKTLPTEPLAGMVRMS
jgi:hypothetical protein